MKVVYKNHIRDEILAEIDKAKQNGERIEKIILTREEYWQLEECISLLTFLPRSEELVKEGFYFFGIKIEIEGDVNAA